jgi:hypothetical protein
LRFFTLDPFMARGNSVALAARFRQLDTSLNDFLFATIGEEQSGMRLSVASALARGGFDPWTEAVRLAGLPKATATEALASVIAAVPFARWMPSEVPSIATRLSLLLPTREAIMPVRDTKPSSRGAMAARRLLWLFYLAVILAALFSLIPDRRPPAETGGSLTSLHSAVSP